MPTNTSTIISAATPKSPLIASPKKKEASNQYFSANDSQSNTPSSFPTQSGHEQGKAVLASFILFIGSVIIGTSLQASSVAQSKSLWYTVTWIQTLFCFLLPVAYPGFAVLQYTFGLGKNGPATRFESFYIESTMGMIYGISHMAFLDHLMFVFAPFVVVLSWMPSAKCQVFASALTCVCGLYMSLWIPTNVATSTSDPGPYILSGILTSCSFARVILPPLMYELNLTVSLFVFQFVLCVFVWILIRRGIERREERKAIHSVQLTNWLCREIGEGPVWQSWPMIDVEQDISNNVTEMEEGSSSSSHVMVTRVAKDFPSGFWFEPTPFGNKTCFGTEITDYQHWPYGDWPSQNPPPESMLTDAQEEMLREMPEFLPSILIMICLGSLVLGLLLALTIWL